MKFSIKSVYRREDIEGFYEAFLAGQPPVRTTKKIVKVITTVIAILFWAFAAIMLIFLLTTGNIRLIFSGLPTSLIFGGIGLFIFSKGRTRFKSKSSWKAYPHKGEQLVYCFYDSEFTLEREHSLTKTAYCGIVRLYEDSERFYLFDSPQTSYILPKRDFDENLVETFVNFISAVTGLPMEHQ